MNKLHEFLAILALAALAGVILSPQTQAVGGPLATLAAIVTLYFVPWIVAARRHHGNKNAIAALNILLGWTGLGWVAAFVWSLTKTT